MHKQKSPSIVYWLGNNLYLNITNRCSNSCLFCIRNFKNGVGGFNLKLPKEPSANKVISELQGVINLKNWEEIVFCGFGEPLIRLECILEACRWIKSYYGKAVVIRIDTNGQGYLINNDREIVKELKASGVNKVSVSLNADNEETYNQICRPIYNDAFESILEFIEKAKKVFEVEITAITMPEVKISEIEDLAGKMGVGFRTREYIPCSW